MIGCTRDEDLEYEIEASLSLQASIQVKEFFDDEYQYVRNCKDGN